MIIIDSFDTLQNLIFKNISIHPLGSTSTIKTITGEIYMPLVHHLSHKERLLKCLNKCAIIISICYDDLQ